MSELWLSNLADYRVVEALRNDGEYLLCRAIREQDGRRVLIRARSALDGGGASSHLRHEFEVARKLDLRGVLQPIVVELYRGHAALIFDDFDGRPLLEAVGDRPMPLDAFLRLAIALSATIAAVHAKRIIHQQLKPANILYDAASGDIKLIGFDRAEPLRGSTANGTGAGGFHGTLAYVAPEQTGRLARGIDCRSDLYSLGVIFYRLLAAKLPFDSESPAELIYLHLTRPPPPLVEARADLPEIVSKIVLKLLAKDPAQRYQGAFGLQADLMTCLEQLETTGAIAGFALGARDLPQDLRLPTKLYGRETELDAIKSAVRNAAEGQGEIVLVSGSAGVGKSLLSREAGRAIVGRGGHFAAGKFDQLRRDVPYSALLEAFQDLVRQLLAESRDRHDSWRQRLLAALRGNAQLMIQTVPPLELLLGPQPPVPPLPSAETTTRFHVVIAEFVRALATAENPLVLLLDDLQWADTASVNLLRLLVADRAINHLTLIAAYRDNEIQPFSPFAMLRKDLAGAERPIRDLHLGALRSEDVARLLADALHTPKEAVAPLAAAVFAKTEGNAFFVKEFVTSLYYRDALWFDPQSGGWRWDLAAVAAQDVTGNVIDLVRHRMDLLPQSLQRTVQIAAAIGNRFSLGTVATVCERPVSELHDELIEAVAQALIAPETPAAPGSVGDADATFYRFVHDRIQQAAYAQIDAADRPLLHQRIGRLLRRASSATQLEENLFEIANHLNAALSLPEEEGGAMALAALNLRAARKAKSSAAYETAWRYVEIGLRLVAERDWVADYETLFGLYAEATELAYLLARYDEMQRFAALAIARARSVLDQVAIHEIVIRYANSSMQFPSAVETGLKAAALLGEILTPNPSKLGVVSAFVQIRALLHGRGPDTLRRLPDMTDPQKLAALRVMSLTASAAYFARPNLFVLIVLRMVQMSVKHGAASLSAFAYVCYGLLLCAVRGEMRAGFDYGQLALATVERFNARELRAKIVFLFNVFIAHWTQDIGGIGGAFRDAAATGLETGDLEFFSYNLYMHCGLKLIDGEPLGELTEALQEHHAAVTQHKQDKVELLLRMVASVVAGLRSDAAETVLAAGFAEEEAVAIWRERHDYSALGYFYCFKTFTCFAAGDYARSAEYAELAHRCYDSILGQPFVPFFLFYESLTLSERLPELKARARQLARHKLAANRRKLQRWAREAPSNYLRKARLLDAEWSALRGRPLAALRAYDEAIALAARDCSLLDEGLAAERAAQFCLRRGLMTAGQQYLARARATYRRWGAPSFRATTIATLQRKLGDGAVPLDAAVSIGGETPLHLRPSEIDFDAVIRATRTLSQQVVLADVLRELLTIAIANAGATRGLLLLRQHASLSIAAEAEPGKPVRVLPAEQRGAGEDFPSSVADYALRTRTSTVLNNALEEGPFTADLYITTRAIRSILCLPLHNQGEIVGILYLENDLTANAFTAAHLDILRIFAAQAAISIRNAELYGNLEKSLAEQVALTSVHRRFVPHQFLVALGKQRIADVTVGDKVLKTLSVLFADMRSYSSMSERLSPKDDLEFVNAFFGQIESAIVLNRGFIDNYYGDGIMALFESEADDSVRAGIALLRALFEYNEPRERLGMAAVRVGVGINTGEVMLGTIGGATSIKCTVIGDSVNLANRIETLTKHFDTPLLIGETTYAALKDPSRYMIRHVGRVRVKGRSRPVTIYEVFDADRPALRDAKLATAAEFRFACESYYRRDFPAASAAFEACLAACPGDKAAALFLQHSRANSLGVAEEWDGTETVLAY